MRPNLLRCPCWASTSHALSSTSSVTEAACTHCQGQLCCCLLSGGRVPNYVAQAGLDLISSASAYPTSWDCCSLYSPSRQGRPPLACAALRETQIPKPGCLGENPAPSLSVCPWEGCLTPLCPFPFKIETLRVRLPHPPVQL